MKKKGIASIFFAIAMTISLAACGNPVSTGSQTEAANNATDVSTKEVQENAEATTTPSNTTTDSTAKTGNSYKIGIANREITNDYNRLIAYGAKDILENAGCEVTMTDAEADVQKHSENIESLINSGIDALIIQLGDNDQLASLCKEAMDKGITVVTAGIGSHIENTVCDINGDDALMATLAADAIFDKIGYSGNVYVFYVPGAPLLENRLSVFQAVASIYPDITITPVSTEHNVSKVQTQMEDLLTSNPERGSIAAVFGTYDSLISGAVESVRQAGRDEIVMGGIDGDELSFQMLFEENSPFQVSVVMDAASIGETAANTVLDILNGNIDPNSMSKKVLTACYVATRKNGVEAAEAKWGNNVWDDIKMSKSDIESKYPQTDTLQIITPTVP